MIYLLIITHILRWQIPMLENTSAAPSIVLVNSLASVIPAPTRTIYASTKASSLVLYQALSIEHPRIAFTHYMPYTVEGDFRASAVDSGPVREKDPNATGLKREDVRRGAYLWQIGRRRRCSFLGGCGSLICCIGFGPLSLRGRRGRSITLSYNQ